MAENLEEEKEGIDVEEVGDGAIQHLIFHSFYPLTCMVPLGEDFITIKENAPDMMKAKENDSLLQETIKTFQSLMQEKDDEILNLKRQLKSDSTEMVKMTSESIQTDLTLEECNNMEHQLIELSAGLPDKVEKIHQLQLEKSRLQESFQDVENDKIKINQLEEDLNDSLKNLLELEESNLNLSKENQDLKQNCLELNWKLEEINDLKVEVELAKIQTEEDMNKIKETVRNQDILIQSLKNATGSDNKSPSQKKLDEKDSKYYEDQILELEKLLKCAQESLKEKEQNKNNIERTREKEVPDLEVSDLIVKVRDKIFDPTSQNALSEYLVQNLPNYSERFGSSDVESIKELISIASDEKTNEKDLKNVIAVLNAIEFNENGEIDHSLLLQNMNNVIKRNEKSSKTTQELQMEAINTGLMKMTKEVLLTSDKTFIKSEYMKLELILNTLNRSYKMTEVRKLNTLSNMEMVDKILKIKESIFAICMHEFWENIFDQPTKETDPNKTFSVNSTDFVVLKTLIFPNFKNETGFENFLLSLADVRDVLLVGECSGVNMKANNLFLMKMFGVNLYHDICNHLLPLFPKETRYVMMGKSYEEIVCNDNKLLEVISSDFSSFLYEYIGKKTSDIFSVLFDILLNIDFEDEFFSITSKYTSSKITVCKVSISSSTGKIENVQISVDLKKNMKQHILSKIQNLQNIMHNITGKNASPESYKLKSESELVKVLIEKKENLLKTIFKSSFHPMMDKRQLSKDSIYISCVSKERVDVDLWIKNIIEKYNQKLIKQLNDITLEEMEICLLRLNQALKRISSSYVIKEQDTQRNKSTLVSLISQRRKLLRSHINQYFLNNSVKLLLTQNIEQMIKQDQTCERSNTSEDLKEIFSIPEVDKIKLERTLQKLYDIDCEIYPGEFDQNMEKKPFSSISDSEIFDEILILRLSIAAFVILPGEPNSTNGKDISDYKKTFKTLKEIETLLLQMEDGVVEENIISTEVKQLKVIIGNLKKKKKIDNEKLKTCYLALKKIECAHYNASYDATKSATEFEKIKTKNEKQLLVLHEAENLFNVIKLSSSSQKKASDLSENYTQIEELLVDMEEKMTKNESKNKGLWTYSVLEKTEAIKSSISSMNSKENSKNTLVRDNVMNNLDDIKLWTQEQCHWRKDCFNKLNNLIKRLNSKVKNRKIEMSISDNSEFNGNFQDEKVAFEKAFTHLENRFNDLTSENEKKKSKTSGIDLEKKSDDELRNIILELEKELSEGKWTKSDENDAKSWLNSREREELLDDCNNLLQRSLLMKIDEMLSNNNKKPQKSERPINENQISKFEDDINAKLAKYEELCETVENLKIPQQQISRKVNSSNQFLAPETFRPSQNETISSSEKPITFKSYSPAQRSYSSQTQNHQNNDEDIDLYFQQRMEELQRFIKFPNNSTVKNTSNNIRIFGQNGSDVLVDGFEIEDEKTPRYYSMKLQDIQHERKEDEMGALLHHLEKHRMNLLAENENLQQQLYISNNVQENQSMKLINLEKTEDILRQRLAAMESENSLDVQKIMNSDEMQIMRHERQRLTAAVATLQKRMDELNSDNIALESSNVNFQQENHSLIIKNQYLERSINKLEAMYEDIVQQLDRVKSHDTKNNQENYKNSEMQENPTLDRDGEQMIRVHEKDKIELVKKLDIIDQQNKLLKKHCEKMNDEISALTSKLTEAKSKSETYFKQNQQLVEVLDKMKAEKRKTDSPTSSNYSRNKDEEIKQLKNKIHHLETRLVSSNEAPSGERLKQELIANKDKEIMRLSDQIGSLQDRLDETRAQLEVKDYENRKLQTLTKQLQNQINEDSYYPPPGYKLVKDN